MIGVWSPKVADGIWVLFGIKASPYVCQSSGCDYQATTSETLIKSYEHPVGISKLSRRRNDITDCKLHASAMSYKSSREAIAPSPPPIGLPSSVLTRSFVEQIQSSSKMVEKGRPPKINEEACLDRELLQFIYSGDARSKPGPLLTDLHRFQSLLRL